MFAPQEDSSWVPAFLDELAAELRARLQAAGVDPLAQRRQALTMLNALLFGPRSPEDQRPEAVRRAHPHNPMAEAAATPRGASLFITVTASLALLPVCAVCT